MAHKTLIGGTAYEISGGKTLVNGTAYNIDKGKTLVGGTAYEVGFGGEFVPLYNFGSVTPVYSSFMGYALITNKPIDPPTFDVSSCNALVVNGDLYEVRYRKREGTGQTEHQYILADQNDDTLVPTEEYPYSAMIRYYHSDYSSSSLQDTWAATFYCLEEGTYEVSIGCIE